MSGFDPSTVRARFPALGRRQDGRSVVFADAPGGTQVPRSVIDAMTSYLQTSNANLHGAFWTSRETDDLIDRAHLAAGDLLGADADEVLFGPNATSLLFQLSRSIARTLGDGDEIIVTRLDHDANIRPWLMAADDAGATVRWADIRDDDVTLDERTLAPVLGERTRVVAFTLASNAVGTVTPATELVRMVRERAPEALIAIDAVHAAQHRPIDVRALGCDLLVCSPYKIFGPHLGLLFGRRELLAELRPYKVRPAPDDLPHRWETGTQNHEGLAGFVAAVDYLASLAGDVTGPRRNRVRCAFEDAIVPYEADLSRRFLDGIASIPDLSLFGIRESGRVAERTPTFAVRLGDQHPLDTAKALGERGIFVWDGHYYALELMERLGLEQTGGAVRIGFCHYNTPDEVDRVLGEVAALG